MDGRDHQLTTLLIACWQILSHCGISFVEKEVHSLLREAAADDVRFFPCVYHKMMVIFESWTVATQPRQDNINVEESILEEEVLSVLSVPPGKWVVLLVEKDLQSYQSRNPC
ncbi:uncharacterized protein LOC105157710 isoform X2 [Sesamum indicum]|uniref:Uncharacterized protein LOC105157710 isoform X2 n=1 Tax=Sesamum indicum TaxID=4182 RepID=A0A6I9SQE3_SESIN|nr:uncharacterized protein LOC105157710 isoform X2 [Sesamum indicum]